MDPHADCPEGGLWGITAATLAAREALVFDACRARHVPVAFALAGGYGRATRSRRAGGPAPAYDRSGSESERVTWRSTSKTAVFALSMAAISMGNP
jgi:hypothetical protein